MLSFNFERRFSSLWVEDLDHGSITRNMFSAACSNRIRRIITGVLAIILLNGILASILPLETLAGGQMCTLACCAGQPSHAAGSCMDGSCHAVFKRTDHNHRSQRQLADQLCGLASFSRHHLSQRSAQTEPKQDSIVRSAMGRPCDPNCGGVVFISSTQSRPREFSTVAYKKRPRTRSPAPYRCSVESRFKTLDGFGKQVSPRGPPVLFS